MCQTFICRWSLLFVVGSFLTNFSSLAEPQTGSPAAPIPPPGQLVDVGGWSLHLYCTGEAKSSQPTVILEPGTGDFSVEWSLVQPKRAASVRVCSYDRAGDGWSELGPHPRTMHQIAYELHVLLGKAGVRPPYMLVGHSYGGWLVRLYASKYRSDVAGMVLVEGGFDNPWRMVNGKLVRAEELATGKPTPAVKNRQSVARDRYPGGRTQTDEGRSSEFGPWRERAATRQAAV
jgi:pimeloyl-ACP methyl ester carboxylesterase